MSTIISEFSRTLLNRGEPNAKAYIVSTVRNRETFGFFLQQLDNSKLLWTMSDLSHDKQPVIKIVQIGLNKDD